MVDYEQAPWYSLAYLCLAVHGVLSMLACFYKPDFLNLTLVGLVLLALQEP